MSDSRVTAQILCSLRSKREQAGLSQLGLAARVGVSRQALIAIEAGRQVPSTGLALQLARALGCRVDDLFSLALSDEVEVVLASSSSSSSSSGARRAASCARLALAQVDGVWVAHRLHREQPAAADAILLQRRRGQTPARARLLCDPARLAHNVLAAGCAPLLGVLAQRVGLRYRDARVTWVSANSRRALDLLARGLVHVAGLHLCDGQADDANLPAVRRRFPHQRMLIVHLTRWRQGLVLAPGNPLGVRTAADLLRPDVRVARRERGAGASKLLQRYLAASGIEQEALSTTLWARGHRDIARLISCRAADVGVAIESVAIASGLDFVPLAEERFDLAIPADRAERAPVARLIDTISDRAFRAEVATMPGYDGAQSGHVTTLEAA